MVPFIFTRSWLTIFHFQECYVFGNLIDRSIFSPDHFRIFFSRGKKENFEAKCLIYLTSCKDELVRLPHLAYQRE